MQFDIVAVILLLLAVMLLGLVIMRWQWSRWCQQETDRARARLAQLRADQIEKTPSRRRRARDHG